MERLDIAPPRGMAASLNAQTTFGPLIIAWIDNMKVCRSVHHARAQTAYDLGLRCPFVPSSSIVCASRCL